MKAFEKFNKEYKAIIAIVISLLSVFITKYVEDMIKDKAIATATTAGFLGLVTYFIGGAFDRSKYLRRKLLGDDFIDGYYFDNSTDTSHVTLVQIKFKNEGYVVEEENYDIVKEDFHVAWQSVVSCYKDKKLYTNYTQMGGKNEKDFSESGILNITFSGSPTSMYSGYYQDYTSSLEHKVRGIKFLEEELKQFNHFKTLNEKKKYIQQKLEASIT